MKNNVSTQGKGRGNEADNVSQKKMTNREYRFVFATKKKNI